MPLAAGDACPVAGAPKLPGGRALPGLLILLAGNLCAQKSADLIYLGEKVCRECHHSKGNRDQFNTWRLSRHSKSYAALFKPEAKKIAELSGIKIKPYESL